MERGNNTKRDKGGNFTNTDENGGQRKRERFDTTNVINPKQNVCLDLPTERRVFYFFPLITTILVTSFTWVHDI